MRIADCLNKKEFLILFFDGCHSAFVGLTPDTSFINEYSAGYDKRTIMAGNVTLSGLS